MKIALLFATAVAAAIASSPAAAATAYWTGNMKQVMTVTNQVGWNCEYNYAGRTFWQVYLNSCPSSVEVQ